VTGRVVCGGRAVSPLMQREACKKVTFAPEYQSISQTSSFRDMTYRTKTQQGEMSMTARA